jgi:nucleotide-binding universal stress UspA family protein
MTADGRQHTSGKRIVVGIDGSPSSREALRWAQDEAEARGGTVTAVIAWAPSPMAVGAGLPPRIPDTMPDAAARQVLETTVSSVYGDGGSTVVEQRVEHGSPARVLIDLSQEADLVVVGAHAKSGFAAGLSLGSVSQQLAAHSHCPVVVLPAGIEA